MIRRALGHAARALALLGAAACAVLATPPAGACAAGGPLRLTIAFTGDVGGYLEPCG